MVVDVKFESGAFYEVFVLCCIGVTYPFHKTFHLILSINVKVK
jgi:hypothetical protein